jgi:diaminopimelate decarboxylase
MAMPSLYSLFDWSGLAVAAAAPLGLMRLAKQGVRRALVPMLAAQTGRPELSRHLWSLEQDERGLSWEGVSLAELAATQGSPLHVVNARRLKENFDAFQNARTPSGRSCEIYYSYKTNPVPGVLSLLHGYGAGAEVISPYELWLARKLGVPPERILYNGPAKSDASLEQAINEGLGLINLNHREELPRVVSIARRLGKRPRVGVRVAVVGGWSGQFGESLQTGAALEAFREAQQSDALNVVALHAHRGLLIRTAAELDGFLDAVLAFTDVLHAELGLSLEVLDLGGSLAIPTVQGLSAVERRLNRTFQRPVEAPDVTATLSIADYTQRLLARVEAHFDKAKRPCPRIALEPGRALTGNTQLLLARVLGVKGESDERPYAVLDAGIHLAESVQYDFHQLFCASRPDAAAERSYALAGPICSPGDVTYPAARLPRLREGDVLAIMDSGAYFVPTSTTFSFPRPAIVIVEEGKTRVVRRAETFEDLAALDAP